MKTEPNDVVFPSGYSNNSDCRGLSKREYFALLIMNSTVTNALNESLYTTYAQKAIQLADILIKELNKDEKE